MSTRASPKKPEIVHYKPRIKSYLLALIAIIFVCQLQPVFVSFLGGVAGSFGLRPTSHLCLGLKFNGNTTTSLFPQGEVEYYAGLFHFRYSITERDNDSNREYCLGQDIWFGE